MDSTFLIFAGVMLAIFIGNILIDGLARIDWDTHLLHLVGGSAGGEPLEGNSPLC